MKVVGAVSSFNKVELVLCQREHVSGAEAGPVGTPAKCAQVGHAVFTRCVHIRGR